MKKKEQIRNLKKIAKSYKVETDIIDFEALVDSKLSYDENKAILIEMIKSLTEKVDEKINTEFKRKEKSSKNEKEEKDRAELEMLKQEQETSQVEFEKSIKEIKETKSEVLKNLYHIPREYIKSVAKGFNNSLIILGKQGLGKSFLALETLNGEKVRYVYHSGFSSPMALYKLLYENKDENVVNVFDDTYGLVSQPQALTIILKALYSVGEKREIMWNSTTAKLQIPTRFIYNAKTILITNELPKISVSKLILSRCLVYEFNFRYEDVLKIMYEIAKTKHSKLNEKERLEIVDFIKENTDESTENFDLRLQQHIENLYLYDKENYKRLSLSLLTKDERLYLLKKFIQESSTIKDACRKWKEHTGQSERCFYYLKAKIF